MKILFLLLFVVCTTIPCNVGASDGRSLDVFTQKGGKGFGSHGGIFDLREVVNLTANVTYNSYPVQNVVVAFVVRNPKGDLYFIGCATTGTAGLATLDFRIRMAPEGLGTWTVVASVDIACIVVLDSLAFEVNYSSPPHGPSVFFTENKETLRPFEEVEFDASESMPGWDGFYILPITEYRWNFGDGNITVTYTPIVRHAYNQSGVYYVTLEVYAPGANPETAISSPQRKVVIPTLPPLVVGGYSIPIAGPSEDEPLAFYFALLAMCVVSLAAFRRKPEKEAHLATTKYSIKRGYGPSIPSFSFELKCALKLRLLTRRRRLLKTGVFVLTLFPTLLCRKSGLAQPLLQRFNPFQKPF